MLSNIKIQTLGWALVALITLLAAAFIAAALETKSRVDQIEAGWHSFEAERVGKRQALYRVYSALGYGGMIHNFKNLVLRGDLTQGRKAAAKIDAAKVGLAQYRTHEVSAEENTALAEVETMLGDYRVALAEVVRMVREGRSPSEIDAATLFNYTQGFAALETLYTLSAATTQDAAGRHSMWTIIGELQRDTGFGGMIHQFKDFILRGEPWYMEQAIAALAQAEVALAEYQTLENTPEEIAALADLHGVFSKYAANIEAAARLASAGRTPREIDLEVRVDDDPALLALERLTYEIVVQNDAQADSVNGSLNRLSWMSQILVPLASVLGGLAIAVTLWLVRGQIIRPVRRITEAMQRLAEGDLEVEIADKWRGDEFGDMVRSIDVFRQTALNYRKSAADLQKAKDTLESRVAERTSELSQAVLAQKNEIAQRKKFEVALAAARDEAERADRAKSEFLANMSHELRTPLNAIIGFSGIMRRKLFGPVGDTRYGEYAEDIENSAEHLLSVINDLLDLSKVEAGQMTLKPTSVDLGALTKDCIRIVAQRAGEAGLAIQLDIPDDLPRLWADPRLCKQMLYNLLSNAVKFTDRGGKITVAAKRRQGGGAQISVSDTGIGIAQEHMAIVLEPFGQADGSSERAVEGTGLGLPLVKSLAELHGGGMELTSELGVGTTATIWCPGERLVAELESENG